MQARILHLVQAVTTVWVLVTLLDHCSAALVYTYTDITAAMDLIINVTRCRVGRTAKVDSNFFVYVIR